jgi:hypothetical protein
VIKISNFRVVSFDTDHLDLFWDLSQADDLGEYAIAIERSESPLGPWDTLISGAHDLLFFRDNTIHSFHPWRKYFYKVTFTHSSGHTIVVGPESVGIEPNLEAQEVAMTIQLILQEVKGRKCWIFKRRTFGQRCGCVDPIRRRRVEGRCSSCYSTGFVGGYYSPIQVYAWIDSKPLAVSEPQPGAQRVTINVPGYMAIFPPVVPDDILIDSENTRWRIAMVSTPERLGSPIRQDLQLHRLDTSRIEYSIPLNVDASQPMAPEREYTNPSTAS